MSTRNSRPVLNDAERPIGPTFGSKMINEGIRFGRKERPELASAVWRRSTGSRPCRSRGPGAPLDSATVLVDHRARIDVAGRELVLPDRF